MIHLHSSPNPVHMAALKTHLRSAGIEFESRNELLTGLQGEVPADVFPEIWVHPADESAAREIFDRLRANNWEIEVDIEALEREALSHDEPEGFASDE